ncbi:unnamed protein product [Lota lota]
MSHGVRFSKSGTMGGYSHYGSGSRRATHHGLLAAWGEGVGQLREVVDINRRRSSPRHEGSEVNKCVSESVLSRRRDEAVPRQRSRHSCDLVCDVDLGQIHLPAERTAARLRAGGRATGV